MVRWYYYFHLIAYMNTNEYYIEVVSFKLDSRICAPPLCLTKNRPSIAWFTKEWTRKTVKNNMRIKPGVGHQIRDEKYAFIMIFRSCLFTWIFWLRCNNAIWQKVLQTAGLKPQLHCIWLVLFDSDLIHEFSFSGVPMWANKKKEGKRAYIYLFIHVEWECKKGGRMHDSAEPKYRHIDMAYWWIEFSLKEGSIIEFSHIYLQNLIKYKRFCAAIQGSWWLNCLETVRPFLIASNISIVYK